MGVVESVAVGSKAELFNLRQPLVPLSQYFIF
jgi:hypothetical protein